MVDPKEEEAQGDSSISSSLTKQQKSDIFFLVLAFASVVSAQTLIVGTGAVVVISVGGDVALAPFALAAFFLGMAFVSLTVTHWVFKKWGRQKGFWVGICLALFGVGLSLIALDISSPALVLVGNVFMGAGGGIGMYIRFAAIEVVPPDFHSRAMSWVLCGGCLASFAGPEAAHATGGKFGDKENMFYFGVFVVAACFHVLQAFCIYMVNFPPPQEPNSVTKPAPEAEEGKTKDEKLEAGENDVAEEGGAQSEKPEGAKPEEAQPEEPQDQNEKPEDLTSIMKKPDFVLPVFAAILTWSIMAMPMSIFRVTMKETGFTSRASLTVIEFHFLAMYSPGFFSGGFIKKHGVMKAVCVAIVSFLAATFVNVFAVPDDNSTAVPWYAALILLGIGWNFGFTAATMWVTKSYAGSPHLKAKVQAANDFFMFLVSGALMFSTGYIYSGGSSGIPGWQTLNYVIFGLIGLMVLVLAAAFYLKRQDKLSI